MRKNCLLLLTSALVISIPAKAALFTAPMSGSLEVPPTPSTAIGFTTVDIAGNVLTVDVNWTGLIGGDAAAAHIHCCIAPGGNVGVAVPYPNFPAATSGMYTHVFNLLDSTIYTSTFLTSFGGGTAVGSRDALIAGITAGDAYSNIHNATFPGGEIRGLLAPAPVPEPSTLIMLGMGLLGIGAFVRWKARV
jgi:hypothetical protein